MTFSFSQSQHERIEVEVLRYERQPVGEYHDDNWLMVQTRPNSTKLEFNRARSDFD
jgi:hypothetical protein